MEKFDEVSEQLHFWGRLSGLKRIYSDIKEKPLLHFCATFLHFVAFWSIFDFIIYSRRFTNRKDIIKFIANILITMLLFIGLSLYVEMKRNEDEFTQMTIKVRELHRTTIPCLKKIYTTNFNAGYKKCNLLSKIIGWMAVFAQFSVVIMGCVLSYTTDPKPYPLPTFWEISFYPATDWISYSVNMVIQVALTGITIISFVCNSTYIYYISCCTVALLESSIDMVKQIGMISEELSYEGWVKELIESLNTSKEVLSITRELYKGAFYLFEKMSYVSLFISFVIFKIDPKQMGVSFAGLMVVQGLSIMVLLNEQFLDKFDELNYALYDSSWYEMKPKDRRAFILLIQNSQRSVSLSAGGISDLTLQWFSGLIQSGYSAGLILQDLLTV